MKTTENQEFSLTNVSSVKLLNGEVTMLTLSSFDELLAFADCYNDQQTVQVGIDYLQTATLVKVLVDAGGEWLAGYVINASKPMRYLAVFDEKDKRIILRDRQLMEENMAEITCIWISKKLTKSYPVLRLEVYLQSIWDALGTQKEIIIGGSRIFTVWQTFAKVFHKELCFGLVPFEDGTQMAKIVYETHEGLLQNYQDYRLKQALLDGEKEQHLSVN